MPFTQAKYKQVDGLLYQTFSVSHLPTPSITFTLPLEYPDSVAPQLTSLECDWLTNALCEKILNKLRDFCETRIGEPCLWDCFVYLETGLLTEMLGLPLNEAADGFVYDLEETAFVEKDFHLSSTLMPRQKR